MRLLIVDDGHYIVEYLKHLLDWSKFGIEHVETTTNSIEAKELLNQNHVDILITDIRMPEVSGIDLLQHIHEMKIKTKVVFLSGYSQFDYAQQAIRLGALDYLLKPVDKEDMEKAMSQVIESIEKQSTALVEWEKLDGLGYLLSVIGETPSACNDFSTYNTALRNKQFCFFHIPNSTEKDEMTLRDNCDGLESFIWSTPSVITGIIQKSNTVSLASNIPLIAFSEVFEFSQRNTVRHIFHHFFFNENVTVSDFAILRDLAILPKFEPGEWELTRKDLMKNFAKITSRKHKCLYVLELIHMLYCITPKIQLTEAPDWIFNQLTDPGTALQSILQSITQLDRSAKFSNHNIVHTIQSYISDHINECLSLEDLGKIVHLHPVYLSKLYKQETGENLSSFISFKRLEKASKLLIGSNLHVLDISHLVGYKKPQYFIKLFKDQYGITPYQYRRQQIK